TERGMAAERRDEPLRHRALRRFPGHAGADVDRLRATRLRGRLGQEHGTVEPRREEHHRSRHNGCMYLVTKRIEFCYGHRLLDYDGVCKHPHGHNAVVEVDVSTEALDNRNMVADFSDIKRIVKG